MTPMDTTTTPADSAPSFTVEELVAKVRTIDPAAEPVIHAALLELQADAAEAAARAARAAANDAAAAARSQVADG